MLIFLRILGKYFLLFCGLAVLHISADSVAGDLQNSTEKENLVYKITIQNKSSQSGTEEFAYAQLLTEKVKNGDTNDELLITMTYMLVGWKAIFTSSENDFIRTWTVPENLAVNKTIHVNIDPETKEESLQYKAWLKTGVDDFSGQEIREIHSVQGDANTKPYITELIEDYPVHDLNSLIQLVRKWNIGGLPEKIYFLEKDLLRFLDIRQKGEVNVEHKGGKVKCIRIGVFSRDKNIINFMVGEVSPYLPYQINFTSGMVTRNWHLTE